MGNVSYRDLPDTYWTVQNVPIEKSQKRSLILFAASIAGGFLLTKIIRDMTIEYLIIDANRMATELGQCKQLRLVSYIQYELHMLHICL